jgi:hypothetical protein
MGTMSAGTSRWRTFLASLDAGRVYRNLVVPPAELAGCSPVHSAYIPELVTLSGFWRHMAAQPFSRAGSFSQVSTGLAWW